MCELDARVEQMARPRKRHALHYDVHERFCTRTTQNTTYAYVHQPTHTFSHINTDLAHTAISRVRSSSEGAICAWD